MGALITNFFSEGVRLFGVTLIRRGCGKSNDYGKRRESTFSHFLMVVMEQRLFIIL